MKNKITPTHVELHSMVDRISVSFLPFVTRKNSFIINDVPADLLANTDEQMLGTILGSLINTVIANTQDCCIRISAKSYGKIVLFHLKETPQIKAPAFAVNLRELQQLAETIGGTISISHDEPEATTIVFSFANNLPLAA